MNFHEEIACIKWSKVNECNLNCQGKWILYLLECGKVCLWKRNMIETLFLNTFERKVIKCFTKSTLSAFYQVLEFLNYF